MRTASSSRSGLTRAHPAASANVKYSWGRCCMSVKLGAPTDRMQGQLSRSVTDKPDNFAALLRANPRTRRERRAKLRSGSSEMTPFAPRFESEK